LLKTDSLKYISAEDSGPIFKPLLRNELAPKAAEFGRMAQNNGYYAVQGHSRSPILVTIESPYATSY